MKHWITYALLVLLAGLLSCQIDIFGPKTVLKEQYVYALQINVINQNLYPVANAAIWLYDSEASARAMAKPLQVSTMNAQNFNNKPNGAQFRDLLTQKIYYFRVRPSGCPDADTTVYRTTASLKPNAEYNFYDFTCQLTAPLELINPENEDISVQLCKAGDCVYVGAIRADVVVPAKKSLILQMPIGQTELYYVWSWGVTATGLFVGCNKVNQLRLGRN